MKIETPVVTWRSSKAEAQYRAMEAAEWERATTTPPESLDITTSFGPTRAYRWPGDGAPVVFLHGLGDSSLRWIPYANALAAHDVYAIDIMGDVGQSTPNDTFTGGADYGAWLGQTIHGLGVRSPHVVGWSLGGFVALAYAMEPDGPASTTCFEPVGVVKLNLRGLMTWSLRVALASFAPPGMRPRLARRLGQPLITDKAAMKLLSHASRGHPPKGPPLPPFDDDDLASIAGPVRVLAGGNSAAFDAQALCDRITTAVTHGEAHLVADAGHAIALSHFDDCLALVRKALTASA
jgi:pimeloyl-ACP methyl ester carboxylesterase